MLDSAWMPLLLQITRRETEETDCFLHQIGRHENYIMASVVLIFDSEEIMFDSCSPVAHQC